MEKSFKSHSQSVNCGDIYLPNHRLFIDLRRCANRSCFRFLLHGFMDLINHRMKTLNHNVAPCVWKHSPFRSCEVTLSVLHNGSVDHCSVCRKMFYLEDFTVLKAGPLEAWAYWSAKLMLGKLHLFMSLIFKWITWKHLHTSRVGHGPQNCNMLVSHSLFTPSLAHTEWVHVPLQ